MRIESEGMRRKNSGTATMRSARVLSRAVRSLRQEQWGRGVSSHVPAFKAPLLEGVGLVEAPFFPLLPAPPLDEGEVVIPRLRVPVATVEGVEVVDCAADAPVRELIEGVAAVFGAAADLVLVVFADGTRVPRALRIRDLLSHSWAIHVNGVVVSKIAPARSTRGVVSSRTVPSMTLALGHGGAKGTDEMALLETVRGKLRVLRDSPTVQGGMSLPGRRSMRFPEFVQLVRDAMSDFGAGFEQVVMGEGSVAVRGPDDRVNLAPYGSSLGRTRNVRLRGSEKELILLARSLVTELERAGDVVRVRHGADSSHRDALVLLRPADHLGMARALDLDGAAVRAEIEAKAGELATLLSRLERMDRTGSDIVAHARSQARGIAVAAGLAMVAQYGAIFYQIYTVSWDTMEPLCYFLGQFYAVMAYAYFLSTRAEPDNANIFQWLVDHRRAAMHAKLEPRQWRTPGEFDHSRSLLVRRVAAARDEIAVLFSRLGVAIDNPDLVTSTLSAPAAVAALRGNVPTVPRT
jgi:hypothetical protein